MKLAVEVNVVFNRKALEEEGEESRLLHLDTEEIGERIANTIALSEGIYGLAGVRLEQIIVLPGGES